MTSGPAGSHLGRRERTPLAIVLAACAALLVVTVTLGVAIGSVPLSPATVWRVVAGGLAGHQENSVAGIIVWQIRLPRVLLAAAVGAALTAAGSVVQVLVRNALADPFLLGVSSGASVGATAVLLLGAFASLGVWAISVGSVLGALAAMAAVFLVSRSGPGLAPTQLILCGVVLSALFESVIKTLVLTESCAHVQPGKNSISINDTYTDLRNLGAIFGVQGRARQLIFAMQAQVAAVRAKVASLKPITVFDYDSGDASPVTGPGLAMPTPLISLAGGINIFAGLKQSWTTVSWEQVAKAQPQCIIINDYGTPTAAQKEKFLETFAASKNLPAVKNRCFLPLSYDQVTPSPRNGETVVALAKWLHPAAFGLPADGS